MFVLYFKIVTLYFMI